MSKTYTILFVNDDDEPMNINQEQYLRIKKLILQDPFVEINGHMLKSANIRHIVPHEDKSSMTFPGLMPAPDPTPEQHERSREQLAKIKRNGIIAGYIKPKPEDLAEGGCMFGLNLDGTPIKKAPVISSDASLSQ